MNTHFELSERIASQSISQVISAIEDKLFQNDKERKFLVEQIKNANRSLSHLSNSQKRLKQTLYTINDLSVFVDEGGDPSVSLKVSLPPDGTSGIQPVPLTTCSLDKPC